MITAKRVAAVLLLLVLPVAYHVTDVIAPACMPPRQANPVLPEHVPSILLRSLRERLGAIALPRESFNATDVAWFENTSNRRFMFFWKADRRWIVATEQGGFAYNNPIFLYELGEDERRADLIAEKVASPSTSCAVASDLIAAP